MNLGPAIILIVIAVVAGYVFGIIDSRMTNAMLKKKEKTEAPDSSTNTDSLDTQPANRIDEHTVLKMTIDKALKWHLELDGVLLENPAEMTIEQRQRAVSVVVQMRPWLEGKTAPPVAIAPVPAPIPDRTPTPPIKEQTPAPKDSIKLDAMRGLRSLLNNDIKNPAEKKGLSIVAMIDEVLQAKLLGTHLIGKSIRLEDGPNGEVIFCVGPNRYDSVNDVPDPEIQEIIKQAIADWEKR